MPARGLRQARSRRYGPLRFAWRGQAVPAPRQLSKTARNTSDEHTVLYSNGPDDRSVKLALGYVTLQGAWGW